MRRDPHIETRIIAKSDSSSDEGPLPQEKSAGLDDQLCFALYAATNAVVLAYRPLLRAVGLTYPQYVVLMALWESDNVGAADLSVRVRMPLSDPLPIIERLIDAELVERRRTHLGRRLIKLALTDRGRLMEERAVTAQHQVRCQTQLSTAALQQLRSSLHDLTDSLDGHSPRHKSGADVA